MFRRLAPPPLPEDPALALVLAGCFARRPLELPPAGDAGLGGRVAGLAAQLGLAALLASRVGLEPALAAWGEAAAAELQRARGRAAGRALAQLELIDEIAAAAHRTGVPVVWLKFAGLAAAGVDVVGRRPASDVDLLLPEEHAGELVAALAERGLERSLSPQPPHQIATLVRADSGAVDLHRYLPHFRLPGQHHRSPRFEELRAAGLLVPAAGLPAGSFHPAPALAAAHALVHGLVHNRFTADAPQLRLLGDLADLHFAEEGGPDVAAVAALCSEVLAAAEVDELARLLAALGAGRLPDSASAAERGAARWLAHAVALATRPEYAASLKLRAALQGSGEGPLWRRSATRLRRLFLLSAIEVEAIYGPQSGRGAILRRQLGRPFDLLRRAWRGGAASRRELH